MTFTIKPQIHKATFYIIIPFLIGQIIYAVINPFGHDEQTLAATSLIVAIIVLIKAMMSIFSPWFHRVTVDNNLINQSTEVGGDITLDIYQLDLQRSNNDDGGLLLINNEGQKLELSKRLFKSSDLKKIASHIDTLLAKKD